MPQDERSAKGLITTCDGGQATLEVYPRTRASRLTLWYQREGWSRQLRRCR